MNEEENNNTSLPGAINLVLTAGESPFPPDSATTNTAIMQITANQNPSPETVAAGTSTMSSFLTFTSSAAIGDNNNLSSTSSKKTSSKKRAFVPADPALGGRGTEMGAKKAKKENDKTRAEEIKEKRFNELKSELHQDTK
jgi:hypothetical protein